MNESTNLKTFSNNLQLSQDLEDNHKLKLKLKTEGSAENKIKNKKPS